MGQVYQNLPQGQAVGYLYKSFIPVISCSSGTMGNNGALSAITALPTTYTGGAWVWLPAGAIAAGVPAAASYYWVVFSSATAGTVFNNTWNGIGSAAAPAATVPFVTTGPGAFVGNTSATALVTLPMPTLGPNGGFRITYSLNYTNSAGTKTHTLKLGSSNLWAPAAFSTTTNIAVSLIAGNSGTNANQVSDIPTATAGTVANLYTTVSMTTTQNLTINNTGNTATDNFVVDFFIVEVFADGN